MVTITLYAGQKKRHRCIEQTLGLCGRRRGWDVSERIALKLVFYQGWNRSPAQVGCMRQVLRPGALGWSVYHMAEKSYLTNKFFSGKNVQVNIKYFNKNITHACKETKIVILEPLSPLYPYSDVKKRSLLIISHFRLFIYIFSNFLYGM